MLVADNDLTLLRSDQRTSGSIARVQKRIVTRAKIYKHIEFFEDGDEADLGDG